MKYFYIILASLFFISPASAQSSEGIGPTAFVHQCNKLGPMVELVTKLGQHPLVVGKGVAKHISGVMIQGNVTLWLHPEGDTFLVTLDNGEVACTIIGGTNMYPYTAPDPSL